MVAVVQRAVVLRLVLRERVVVVVRDQMANLAPFVFFGCQFPKVVYRQLAYGRLSVVRLPLEWRRDLRIWIQLDLSGLGGALPVVCHKCEFPEKLPFGDVRVPLGSESQHG